MDREKPLVLGPPACEVAPEDHCAICGDEAVEGRVVAVDHETATAEVDFGDTVSTVALDLVDDVAVGDAVMVHQGFAIGRMEQQ